MGNRSSGDKLCTNCAKGDIHGVRQILHENPTLIEYKRRDNTPLYWASWNGRQNIVELLIGLRADVNARCYSGRTPLMIAASYGQIECVRLLLDGGANWALKSNGGKTASEKAANYNHREIVQLLDDCEKKSRMRVEKLGERVAADDRLNAQKSSYTVCYDNYEEYNGREEETTFDEEFFKIGEQRKFDDGQVFVIGGMLGKGVSTFALLVTVDRRPKVLKKSQNDESQSHWVLDMSTLRSGRTMYPFGGKTRREDYELYLQSIDVHDNIDDTLDEWLSAVDSSFDEYEVKTINEKRYCLTKLHDMEESVVHTKRDLVRFLYWYHLFSAMKVAHCDVAPRNVIITFEGPIVIDYGCAVAVGDANLNPLPRDVTPQYYMKNRGTIRRNHDLKGFYVTACTYFGICKDSNVLSALDKRNTMDVMDVFGEFIRASD